MKQTYSYLTRSALALATVSLFGLFNAAAHAQSPKACMDTMRKAASASGLPAKAVTPQNVGTACKNANSRPALALRNFSHRFVTANKIDAMPPAAAALAKQCPGRLMTVSKTLNINPKFANPRDVQTACGRAKGRPVLATRNFLDRFVVTAKIAPSVLVAEKQPEPQKQPVPPKPANPAIAKCAGVVGQTAKTLAIDPKFANAKDLEVSCQKGKAQPQLASFVFLNHFLGANKITPATKIPPALAKQCTGRVASVAKGLRLDAKLNDPKMVAAACKHFRDHAAIAARDLLMRHLKAHKMI